MTEIIDKYYENRKHHADEIFEYLEESINENLFKAYLGDKKYQYRIGIEKKDPEWLLKAAENGHVLAQNTIGVWYNKGINGLEKNIEVAKKWYFKAIAGDDRTACSNIGHL